MKNRRGLKVVSIVFVSILLIVSVVFIIRESIFSEGKSITDDNNTEDHNNTEKQNNTPSLKVSDSGLHPQDLEVIVDNTEQFIIDSEPVNIGTEVLDFGGDKVENRISPKEMDKRVIPDKYNTGCKGTLRKIPDDYILSNIKLKNNNGKVIFDFYYSNKEAAGIYLIENIDFSDYEVCFYNIENVKDKKISIIFKNCLFSDIAGNKKSCSEVFECTYNDCTIKRFYGSDSTFNRCHFGDSYKDCLVPFANITVNDCYFSNLASNDPKGNGTHSDGTQLYGHASAKVENILFSHCRFEIPYVKTTHSTAYVNACIMLSLEYNDGDNIKIEDCLLNGGGYTIYAGKKYDYLNLSNVIFSNIRIGNAKLFGNIYPKQDSKVIFSDVEDQDSLYVSSVWNDGSKTHIIVSNDTGKDRLLRIVTGSGYNDYTIKRCIGGDELRYDNYDMPFEDFPFDIDIVIEDKADYVICFDITDGEDKQIRYVSFDGEPTYFTLVPETDIINEEKPVTEHPKVIIEGSCGREISYYLDESGTLSIAGMGVMYNYNSKEPAPWHDYEDFIKTIIISEGVTKIGSQAFTGLKTVNSVTLPHSLDTIGSNSFFGCKSLKEISIYSGVRLIEEFAFFGVNLDTCTYFGTEETWNKITIRKKNENILTCEKMFMNETS